MFIKILKIILLIILIFSFLFFNFLLNTNFLPFPRIVPNKISFFINMFLFYGFLLISFPCLLYSICSCWSIKILKQKLGCLIKKFFVLNFFLIILAYLLFRLSCFLFGDNGINCNATTYKQVKNLIERADC